MTKETFFEYFKTFLLTILTTVGIVLTIILLMTYQFSNENSIKKQAEDNSIDLKMINILIEKNKYLLELHPENYKIDSKLGFLYETKQDYQNAELEYKIAVEKVPYHEFKPYYDLASLYTKLGRLEEAQDLMDKLGEKPNKKLIKYKAEIYTKLGDTYYNNAEYDEAALRYKKAIHYYDVIKSKEQKKELRRNLASSYVYLADQKIKEMKIDEAIVYINQARLIIKAPILTYKLGLLLTQTDPELACQCFDEVFKKEPSLINYDEYYNLLTTLASTAENNDNQAKAELYEFRMKKIKKYYNENLLQFTDIAISNVNGKITINRLFRNYNLSLSLALTNTSKYNINSLFLDIVFKDGDEVIENFYKQIIENEIPLKSGETLPFISIQTKNKKIVDDYPKEITVQIYASKKEDSYKLLLGEYTIQQETKKVKKTKNWLERFCLKYIFPYIGF